MTNTVMTNNVNIVDEHSTLQQLPPDPDTLHLAKLIAIVNKLDEGRLRGITSPADIHLEDWIWPINGGLQAIALNLHPFIEPIINPDAAQDDRQYLLNGCKFALEALMPQSSQGDDIVFVPLPARVVSVIVDGLHALANSETPPIFAQTHRRHGQAHTWDKARMRAIEHVAFLHGQGVIKKIARERVAIATGAAVDTIREWERVFSEIVSIAEQAGQAQAKEHDSGIPADDLDADVMHLLEQLQRETLNEFGARYRQIAGTRHWGGGK